MKRLRKRVQQRLGRPDVYDYRSGERIGIVFNAPSEMTVPERMLLYSYVRGQRPRRIIEIGSRHGGSASIMAAALMDIDPKTKSRIIGVDPGAEITVPKSHFFGLFELVPMPSPEGIAEAAKRAAEPFDFAMIDGLHMYTQVVKDLQGVLPHLRDGAFILLHDAFHHGVATAIDELVRADSRIHDCGYPCAKPALGSGILAYGGFRVLRFSTREVTDWRGIIETDAAARGVDAPPNDPDLADHDPYWYCKKVQPCAYCRKMGLNNGNGK